MTTKLANLLAQRQAAEAAAQHQAEAERTARLVALRDLAHATLITNLGDYANELLPYIFHKEEHTQQDVLFIEWQLGSHELQLAHTTIVWSSRYTAGLNFKISGGRRYHELNTNTPLDEILFAMCQAYPAYKAFIDEENQRRATDEAAKLKDLITNLTWPANWRGSCTQAQIDKQYRQLIALGEERLAAQCMANYLADVAAIRQREEAAAARKAAYETAMAEYGRQMAAYNEACKEWAEREQARLWQPWTLYRVRYTPWHAQCSVEDTERFPIETICTLDRPEDIVNNANPIAHVEMVDTFGGVTEDFAIATFLDAKPLHFTVCPPVAEGRANYHRTRFAGDYAVNIPPFILDGPEPAPIRPNAPSKDTNGDQW